MDVNKNTFLYNCFYIIGYIFLSFGLLMEYIKEKSLMPISSLYTVNLNEIKTQDELDKYKADIYL